VNQKYYSEVLDHLRKRVMRVQMENANEWILIASSQYFQLDNSLDNALLCLHRLLIIQIYHFVIILLFQKWVFIFKHLTASRMMQTSTIRTETATDLQFHYETRNIHWANCVPFHHGDVIV
jgi:hypothetical protein